MFKASLKAYFTDTDGAAAIEYALLVALLALALVGALTAVGNSTGNTFNIIADEAAASVA